MSTHIGLTDKDRRKLGIDDGTSASSDHVNSELKVAFWNVRNFSDDIQMRRATFDTSDVRGKVSFIYDYLEAYDLDILLLCEGGEMYKEDVYYVDDAGNRISYDEAVELEKTRVASGGAKGKKTEVILSDSKVSNSANEVFGSVLKTGGGAEYYTLNSVVTGDENYYLIIKKNIMDQYVPYDEYDLGEFSPVIIGKNVTIKKTEKGITKHMTARRAGAIRLRVGKINVDIVILHAPSASWEINSRNDVLRDIIQTLKNDPDSHIKLFCGDFNYKRSELHEIRNLMTTNSIEHYHWCGPQDTSGVEMDTSLRTVDSILKNPDDSLSQPYDQLWSNTTGIARAYVASDFAELNASTKEDLIGLGEHIISKINPQEKIKKILDYYLTRKGKKLEGDDLKDRAEKIVKGEFSYYKKKVPNYDADILELTKEGVRLLIEKYNDDTEYSEFSTLLGMVLEKMDGVDFNAIRSKLPGDVLLLIEFFKSIETGVNASLLAAYNYLISDHLPVNFEINLDAILSLDDEDDEDDDDTDSDDDRDRDRDDDTDSDDDDDLDIDHDVDDDTRFDSAGDRRNRSDSFDSLESVRGGSKRQRGRGQKRKGGSLTIGQRKLPHPGSSKET